MCTIKRRKIAFPLLCEFESDSSREARSLFLAAPRASASEVHAVPRPSRSRSVPVCGGRGGYSSLTFQPSHPSPAERQVPQTPPVTPPAYIRPVLFHERAYFAPARAFRTGNRLGVFAVFAMFVNNGRRENAGSF